MHAEIVMNNFVVVVVIIYVFMCQTINWRYNPFALVKATQEINRNLPLSI